VVEATASSPIDRVDSSRPAIILVLLVLLAAGVVISTQIGSVPIAAREILASLGVGHAADETTRTIVLQIRLPRIILAVVVGAGLASAGTVFQGLFRNPMADPYIIGVSAGAALGATVAIVSGLSFAVAGLSAATLLAFAGALGVTVLVYRLAWARGRRLPGRHHLRAAALRRRKPPAGDLLADGRVLGADLGARAAGRALRGRGVSCRQAVRARPQSAGDG
jgi:ABC-type Fe3+-siderophore transport system permease subunit